MKSLVLALALLAPAAAAGVTAAQSVAPIPITGPAQGAWQQLHPPAPLDQVREHATRRLPPLPLPPPPGERWVPARLILAPELGRELVIPGHWERRITDQLYAVPSLPIYDLQTGRTMTVPGGERPPADLRQGP